MKNNLSLLFFVGITASLFSSAYGHPLKDDNYDDDTEIKKIIDQLSVNYPKNTISLYYNNGAITISTIDYCNNLNLFITNVANGEQYTLNTSISEGGKTFALSLSDGIYTISVTGKDYSQLLFLTIEGGIGQSSNQQ